MDDQLELVVIVVVVVTVDISVDLHVPMFMYVICYIREMKYVSDKSSNSMGVCSGQP